MARRKQNKLPKNDFAAEEDLDICGFTAEPIATGDCISSFSFHDDTISETKPNIKTNTENKSNVYTSSNGTIDFNITSTTDPNASNQNNILEDNRKAPIVNGMAPPINGEYLNVKRTYMLRASTVRKINELKSIHSELNTYVSTIVDLAIAHYYEHIISGGSQ
ncbi:hypothetical protein GKZ28_14095 [Clostridium chromiireducens]|uniref:Uncharacterized protein n=1 Tax=Clostridium chromiireducens TaxID=225345 RepID=A0A964RNC5_9CLOT|nr:hypothetical protein [Clostridium chromiireducens]MVX64826.1 hypothetical protein [Clostridium chromiireducens]